MKQPMTHNKLTRREFIRAAGWSTGTLLLLGIEARSSQRRRADQTLYVGTYTSGKSEGIYVYRLNMSTGKITHHRTVKGVADPSYLAIDRNKRFLYAVNEQSQFEGKPSGGPAIGKDWMKESGKQQGEQAERYPHKKRRTGRRRRPRSWPAGRASG